MNPCVTTQYSVFWVIVYSRPNFGTYTVAQSAAPFLLVFLVRFCRYRHKCWLLLRWQLSVEAMSHFFVGVTWVTNPLTMGPMFFFAYKLGAWLLDTQVTITAVELSWSWLSSQIGQIWRPLLVGCLICGWVSGLSGMLVSRILWRLHVVRRWRQRAGRRINDIAL